ncbi:MAG TPA: permease-like cell division protein FtsX [Candidatus Saccharibacteria bacterium]|jgi:cell division transport system permease protein|nr:permease-like cell division protein FtsX [Candidatus Saccharibacteria bacterium]HMR38689.1 permease-like cell division protein FtsX [Candidatus Saccharibacteria bacterium]
MTKHAQATRVLKGKKARRRQWITFVRMIQYGLSNFTRNAWLTIAATAVMTITLLIFFVTLSAQSILSTTVNAISETADMSIYLKTEVTEEQAKPILDRLNNLSSVKSVAFISASEARDQAAKDNKSDQDLLEALTEATNKMPATVRVVLVDINDTSQLNDFVKTDEEYLAKRDVDREPSFAGPRRDAIQSIAGWTILAQRIGFTASAIFVVISSLIIFNTIRMAIFSRKDEIQMMKLIGADKHFIRGPFVVEAIVYGLIAALLAAGIGYAALVGVESKLRGSGVDVMPTIELIQHNIVWVVLAMMVIGALIGTVSSLLATRRYLKI